MRLISLLVSITLAGAAGSSPAVAQLAWHQETGFRWAELQPPAGGQPGFTLLPPEVTGITFTNPLDQRVMATNRMLTDGSGVALGDFDNDGLVDIFLCSLDGHNALYKNLGGMKFKDVTQAAGVDCGNRVCRGAVFADINGDGWLDLLISTTGSGVLCFTNNRNGTFTECSQYAGTLSPYGATTMTLADIDGSGPLDLFVGDNRVQDSRDLAEFDNIDTVMVNGRVMVGPRFRDRFVYTNGAIQEFGDPSLLYLNDGHGRFTPQSWTNGAFLDENGAPLSSAPLDWTLTAAFRDINGDGAPDLYECNDYWTPDRLWINDGKGHFRAAAPLALRHTSKFSMGVDFADIDHDGQIDFYVVDMLSRDWRERKNQLMISNTPRTPVGSIDDRPQIPQNVLFRNRGDGTFEEISEFAGVSASEWSWQPLFMDVDLDGWEDIIISTGFVYDADDLDTMEQLHKARHNGTLVPPKISPDGHFVMRSLQEQKIEDSYRANLLFKPLNTPIVAYRNRGNLKFDDVGPSWGLDQPALHNGIALADLDNDGGLDIVVNNLGSVASVYHNHGSAPRVAVRLKGLSPNTQGIGGKIKLLGGAVRVQTQEVACGGIYLSGSDPLRVFAAGRSQDMTIEVTWRDGRKSTVQGVKPNRLYEIDQSAATAPQSQAPAPEEQPFFKDVSAMISHRHHQQFYDDYQRQPLLPWQLSQAGPAVAWVNFLGDGKETLVIGSGRGGALGIFSPNAAGGLDRLTAASSLPEDIAGIVGWVKAPGQRALIIGRDNYVSAAASPSATVICYSPTPAQQDLPPSSSSTGPLAVADIYGDGTLALFVGGRVIPGSYPRAADSRIYRNVGGQLVLDVENSKVLEKVGLVNGAVWSDLDGDGFPELILACEWGPVRVFKNQRGKLREITHDLGLDRYTGLWHGVTTGDIDGDGQLDIIASNWGLNSQYRATTNEPARIYYGDFSDRNALDLVEAVYDPMRGVEVPRRMRDALAKTYPPLLARYPTHKSYAEASMAQVLAAFPKPAEKVEAWTLASTVFFNRTNHFDAVELPYEAQVSPGFAVNVADFDGDGNEDIFLGQNFFELPSSAVSSTYPVYDFGRRLDAGRGLWLRGIGGGRLEAVPGQVSGILVYGEQRGAAVCDFDGDGRVDLVVSQNGAETKLFHNERGKPGLRVRLSGPPGNPDGIGAVLRLVFAGRMGPAREIHGGSGYWSEDSAVQVMGCPEPPAQIWIRWPGGAATTSAIPAAAREISVDTAGKLTVDR